MSTDATQFRRDFWSRYAELYPDDGVPPGWGRSNAWVHVESADLNVSLSVLHWGVGLALRGRKGESSDEAASRIRLFKDTFQRTLNDTFDGRFQFTPGTEWIDAAGGFDARREFEVADAENWPHMAAWLHYMLQIYLKVIDGALVAQE
jgi:hypothetical protein